MDPLFSRDIVVLSKSDLWGLAGISAKSGEGLSWLLAEIEGRLTDRTRGSSVFMRARHFDKLERASGNLESAAARLKSGVCAWEIVSEDLRQALRNLDGIVGRVDVEEVLGRIFSSFCIGK